MDKLLWVERTKPVSPSKLGVYLECRLRYVLETERPVLKRIGDHPSVLVGTAVHDAAEVLRRRLSIEVSGSVAILEQCIGRLLAQGSPPRQLIAWVLDRYGKNALLPRAQFTSLARFAWDLAHRLPVRRIDGASFPSNKTARIPSGRERRLASAALDIAGRADEIYWAASKHVRIIDFKTGGIRDSEGSPKRSYILQLAAYGLVMRELDPNVDITLELISRGDQCIEKLEQTIVQDVSRVLVDLRKVLPRNEPVLAASLAYIGEHCGSCAYRPSCPTYREKLELESVVDHGFHGFDVSGDNAGVADEYGLYAMRILLRRGFAARISRIPAILFPTGMGIDGGPAAAFGIRSLELAQNGSLPQNFSVVDAQHPRNSAFQACIDIG